MGIARLYVDYHLPDTDLITEDKQFTTIKEIFDRIKQKHSLDGEAWLGTPPRIYMELVQEPQILKAALEDLVNSEAGVPDKVFPVSSFWGRGKKEEKLGIEIAREVLEAAGYLLKPHRYLFLYITHYSVEKKEG